MSPFNSSFEDRSFSISLKSVSVSRALVSLSVVGAALVPSTMNTHYRVATKFSRVEFLSCYYNLTIVASFLPNIPENCLLMMVVSIHGPG